MCLQRSSFFKLVKLYFDCIFRYSTAEHKSSNGLDLNLGTQISHEYHSSKSGYGYTSMPNDFVKKTSCPFLCCCKSAL